MCVCLCVCVVLLGHNTKQKAKYISFSPSWSKAFEKSCPSPASALVLLHIQLNVLLPEASTCSETILPVVSFLEQWGWTLAHFRACLSLC